MRLKFLFFPIILIISLSLFVGYIWPGIADLKMANTTKLTETADLQAISDKQAAIEKVDGQISSDTSGEDAINSYLPATKVEERILTGVNFLANDSSVSLINISLKDKDASSDASSTNTGSSANGIATDPNSAFVAGSTPQTATSTAGSVQYTEATISVSGTYDKIRLFVDQLQHMPVLNYISSLSISPAVVAPSTDPNAAKVDPSILSAIVVVDYGYMPLVKIDNDKVAVFKPDIDNDTIAVIKQYVSQKAPAVDSNGDSDGKSNPFLP